ncbi:MAG: diversity-generating retroelement protein Avd [Pseudanabaena sp. Salubria-1]|nr:diversity-generating retroelement protein Avd [Pseudanabaena sp. Salubria-1]
MKTNELPVIQKTYDLIKWYIPIINRLPRIHKFAIGDRITKFLYEMLEDLIIARYTRDKILILEKLNAKLYILRHQSRLLFDFTLIEEKRYIHINTQLHEIGSEIGGWLKQQKNKK